MELKNSVDCIRSDLILRQLLEEHKSITAFLSAVFGFLKRNTDFYHIKANENTKCGFPEGVKERIVISCLQKYDSKYMLEQVEVPPVEKEVEVISEDYVDAHMNECKNLRSTESRNVAPPTFFNKTEYKNGAIFENYCWSQTTKDLELYVKMPPNIKCSKHIKIDLTPNSITIKCAVFGEEIILDGLVESKFKHKDAVWTLVEGKLHLSLDKCHEMWWDKLFHSEPSIDLTKLDCECYIDELPEASQAAINKLRIEEMEKLQVKQTRTMHSGQMELLEKAWYADGSPFKDQPFDPSLIQFN